MHRSDRTRCGLQLTHPAYRYGVGPSGWLKETDGLPANIYTPATNFGSSPPGLISSPNWGRIVCARHYFAINVGFMDGHVATVELPDLWKLKWHTGWDNNAYNY